MFRAACIGDIERDFLRTQDKCARVTPERLRHEPLLRRLIGPAVKVIAPLL